MSEKPKLKEKKMNNKSLSLILSGLTALTLYTSNNVNESNKSLPILEQNKDEIITLQNPDSFKFKVRKDNLEKNVDLQKKENNVRDNPTLSIEEKVRMEKDLEEAKFDLKNFKSGNYQSTKLSEIENKINQTKNIRNFNSIISSSSLITSLSLLIAKFKKKKN
jgi:hypothetical protein